MKEIETAEIVIDEMAGDSSSPSCGICLSDGGGAVRGRIDSCDHYFCFDCIMQWSKVESRCPMCKRRFTSIRKHVDGFFCLFPSQHDVVNVPQRDQGISRDLALRDERLLNQWSEMRLELVRMSLEWESMAGKMKKFMFLYELGQHSKCHCCQLQGRRETVWGLKLSFGGYGAFTVPVEPIYGGVMLTHDIKLEGTLDQVRITGIPSQRRLN